MISKKTYFKLFFLLTFFCSCDFLVAHTDKAESNVSAPAFQLWKKGKTAFRIYEHEESLSHLDKAFVLFEEQKDWSNCVLVLCEIAENLDKLERFEEMRHASKQAVEMACNYLEEDDKALGQAHHLLGESYWVEAIFNSIPTKERAVLLNKAIHYFDIAEGVFIQGKHWENLINNCLNMAFIRVHLEDDVEKSDSYSKAAIRLVQEKFPDEDSLQCITLSQAYSNLSKNQQRFIGDFDKGIEYANLSLENRLRLPNKLPKDKEWLAAKYLNMGGVHSRKNDKEQAFLYFKKAEELAKSMNPSKTTYHLYHSMGFRNFYFKDYERSIYYGRKALDVLEHPLFSPKGLQTQYRFEGYCFIANQYFLTNQLDSANYYLEKVEAILKENRINFRRRGLMNTYFAKAVYEKNQGQLDQALITMKPCLETLKIPPKINLWLSYSWWSKFLAEIYTIKGEYRKALEYHQISLQYISYKLSPLKDFRDSPSVEEVTLKTFYLEAMQAKAKTLREYYLKENRSKDILEATFKTYSLVIDAVDVVRQGYLAEDSKKWLGENTLDLYEEGIAVSLDLYELTKEPYYQEQVFLFSEKSKANLLMDAISDRQVKSVYLPDSLLQKEKQLQIDLAFYERLLYEEKKKEKEVQDSSKIDLWKDKVFKLKRAEELFHQFLKNEYPQYFEFKYASSKTIGVEEIQKMLDDSEVFIEFFWGEEDLYTFALSHDRKGKINLKTYTIKNIKQLQSQILELIEHHQNPNSDFKEYVNASYNLYKNLLQPILSQLDENITNLIIIPDGMLGHLPFEALITEPSMSKEPNYSIHNLSYLIEDYQINYSYSANLSVQYENRSGYELLPFSSENILTAYAPSFYGDSGGLLVRSCTEDLAKLACAEIEAESLGTQWKGKALVGTKATKQHFLEEASSSSIVHLATHACMDDQNPNFNRIYFSNEEYLTALELYALNLKTELTVLSACNTGNGKLLKGEGLMSLARGFMAAGCPSLVTTLWGVNDCTTKNLMSHFYEHLYNGQRKDEALRNAKLSYLQSGETTRLESHPFYWAAFVQMGDSRAIFEEKSPNQLFGVYSYGAGLILFMLGIGILKRRVF